MRAESAARNGYEPVNTRAESAGGSGAGNAARSLGVDRGVAATAAAATAAIGRATIPRRTRVAVVSGVVVAMFAALALAMAREMRNSAQRVEEKSELDNIREANCFADLAPGENPMIARAKLSHAGFVRRSVFNADGTNNIDSSALSPSGTSSRAAKSIAQESRAFLISSPPTSEQRLHKSDKELRRTSSGEHNSSSMALMDAVLRSSCAKGTWMIEVGANAGWNSLLAASMGCLVCAMEPQMMWARELARSVCLNGFSTRFLLIHAAAGLNESIGARYISESDSTKSHVAKDGEGGRNVESVDVIRVDSIFDQSRTRQIVALNELYVRAPRLFQRKIALLRVSTGESATEADVLLGSRHLLEQNRVTCVSVQLTFRNAQKLCQVLTWLADNLQYSFYHAGPDDDLPRVLVHYRLSDPTPAAALDELARSMQQLKLQSEYVLGCQGNAPLGVPIAKAFARIVPDNLTRLAPNSAPRHWILEPVAEV